MGRNFLKTFFAIAVIGTLGIASAKKFTCGSLNVVDCKTKFGHEFDPDFKVIHVTAVKDLLESCISIGHEIQSELPARDPSSKSLADTLKKLEADLKIIKENENDNKKLAETMFDAMNLVGEQFESDASDKLVELVKKHELKKVLSNRWSDMGVDIGKLYADMYAGLRTRDRKAYPEYHRLKTLTASMQMKDSAWPNMYVYGDVRELLATTFDVPYIKEINDHFSRIH